MAWRIRWLLGIALLAAGVASQPRAASGQEDTAARPNIVWVVVEDMSAHFGCYGETGVATPNVDRLAAQGVRFRNAFVTAPVCSASRSALVTGMYQTSIGAHHHRSGRGERKIRLPANVGLVPALFRQAGYHVSNLTLEDFLRTRAEAAEKPAVRVAKTDYNFEWDAAVYERVHWTQRRPGQPFFVQIQLQGGKLRGQGDGERWPRRVRETLGERTPHEAVKLPPYLPRDPVIVEDWAQYLDCVRYTDRELGRIVVRLREDAALDSTYLFFMTDHGISHVRNKQFCYDGGMRIPLVVRGPGLEAGSVREDVVEHIDLAATSLALAGVGVPEWMYARDILGAEYRPRDFAFSARDRCDETVDRIRAVRDQRFKYIRNFFPERPYLQPNRYKDAKPILQAMRRLHAAGDLDRAQALILAETRPPEELYDLESDPYELENLAGDAEHAERLRSMRAALDAWMERTADRGVESEQMYDSDMAVYLDAVPAQGRVVLRENIELMKRWAAEGN